MKTREPLGMVFFLVLALTPCAAPLSDSLPVSGHYSQNEKSVSRFRLERFLLKQDTSGDYADRSLGYKWSGHAVGAFLWCVDIGVAAYEIKQLMDAIRNQSLVDSTGTVKPFSNNLYKFTIPLTIGTEAASFIQQRLYNRSDYFLHKGALAYNAYVAHKVSHDDFFDLHIDRAGFGQYKQGGLVFDDPVLYGVLMDQRASAGPGIWSLLTRETGIQMGSWGGMFVGLAFVSYLQQLQGDTAFVIDRKAQMQNLTIGVSLVAGSIVCAIVSAIVRNIAIERYNEALPRPPQPVRSEPAAKNAPSDSSGSGIIERPKPASADTAVITH